MTRYDFIKYVVFDAVNYLKSECKSLIVSSDEVICYNIHEIVGDNNVSVYDLAYLPDKGICFKLIDLKSVSDKFVASVCHFCNVVVAKVCLVAVDSNGKYIVMLGDGLTSSAYCRYVLYKQSPYKYIFTVKGFGTNDLVISCDSVTKAYYCLDEYYGLRLHGAQRGKSIKSGLYLTKATFVSRGSFVDLDIYRESNEDKYDMSPYPFEHELFLYNLEHLYE